jgi:hypothetical protein
VPLNIAGEIALLRVHDLGTGYGPSYDFMDVEVVVQIVGRPEDAFGFQLRNDDNVPARQGMLDLLRDAFNYGWTANLDYDIPDGMHNGTIIRVWLTKPAQQQGSVGPVFTGALSRSRKTRGKRAAPRGGRRN